MASKDRVDGCSYELQRRNMERIIIITSNAKETMLEAEELLATRIERLPATKNRLNFAAPLPSRKAYRPEMSNSKREYRRKQEARRKGKGKRGGLCNDDRLILVN
jgi:hypothetical protein